MNGNVKEFIKNHRVARMSTVDLNGKPHIVPIVYVFDGKVIYTPVDSKPKKNVQKEIRRVKNIKNNNSVSLVIDDYSEDWDNLAWVQIRGEAGLIKDGDEYEKGVELLQKKYPQYVNNSITIYMLIIIKPMKVVSWQV